ncbi:MAG: PKD domain-containing protein, partial [Verrucomicrobia bacterium]|nr:PKD domain-containing protein [Verrucomicrobiota bacterium]
AMAPDGRFVITWNNLGQILAKRYDASGQELPPPSGVPLEVGNAFVVKSGPPFAAAGASRFRSDVAMDAAGNFVIVWEDRTGQDGDEFGIFAQRYDAAGNELPPPFGVQGAGGGNEFQVNAFTGGRQMTPSVAINGSGEFVITWWSFLQDGGFDAVMAKRYDSAGNEVVPAPGTQGGGVGNEFQANAFKQEWAPISPGGMGHPPRVAINAFGAFVITWDGSPGGFGIVGGQDCSSGGVFAKRYDAAGYELTPPPGVQGNGIGGEFQVNSRGAASQGPHDVGMNADGRFVIAWYGYSGLPTGRVVAKAYDAAGQVITPPQGSQGNGLCNEFEATTFTAEGFPAVAIAPDGLFTIAWDDSTGADGDGSGIFARRYVSSAGPTSISPLTNEPVLACPEDITVNGDGLGQAQVPDLRSAAVITGVCAPCASITITQDPAPGTVVGCGTNPITLTLSDTAGHTAVCTTVFNVINCCEPPAIVRLSGPSAPLALGATATVTVHFAAIGSGSGRVCAFNWGDGTEDAGLDASTASASATHTYTAPGVYRVTVTASNNCGDTDTAVHEFVVIYDPEGGFVTGGGWIHSPVGAYTVNPTLTGKANFGFVSKYLKGAHIPTGNTEFQFKAGDLNFKSTSYDWLVVAGAKAKFKGSGTINGAGDYAFQLTATDGQAGGGGGTDRLRIKIWNTSGGGVIYDNQPGDPDTADAATALGGGSIVVHKP